MELMPFAKALSAKTYDFDEARPLVTVDTRWKKETDYKKIMQIVVDSGYEGWNFAFDTASAHLRY